MEVMVIIINQCQVAGGLPCALRFSPLKYYSTNDSYEIYANQTYAFVS
jgi:hypothetical protein